jgi:hypothetical protein
MLLIEILLGVAAFYSGGMYALYFFSMVRHYRAYQAEPAVADQMERYTFHLGICFILALGFLGILLRMGGQ